MQSRIFPIFIFALVLLVGVAATTENLSGQEVPESENEPAFYVFKTETGALVVCNDSTAHFTAELTTSTFYQDSPEGVAFLLNGQFINVLTANPWHFGLSPQDPPDQIMQEYRRWETAYWEEQINLPLESEEITEVAGNEDGPYLWMLSWPESWRAEQRVESVGNMFATRMVGDRVVVVALALMEDADYDTAVNAVTEVWQAIDPHDAYIDPEKLQESLRKK